MIEIYDITDSGCDWSGVEKIGESMVDSLVDVTLCDDDHIRRLNHTHRSIDRATDVLSFPISGEIPGTPLGSIVISIETARRVAQRLGHSLHEEVALLLIHGILHLQGYDHETDDGEMRKEEKRWIDHFGLPESLIVRNSTNED